MDPCYAPPLSPKISAGDRQYDGGQRLFGALRGRGELHSDGQCGAEEAGLLAACPTKYRWHP